MKKIQNPHQPTQGKNLKLSPTVEVTNFDYPIFCFKHLHKDHCLDQCTIEEKKSLMEQLVKLSQLSWQELFQSSRHGLGCEKINRSSLKPSCPSFITDDISYLLAFRYDGKKPFLGHRNKFIFHIIFIDRDFTVYKH